MPETGSPRRPSLVFPIVLIVIGALFLFAEWRPSFSPMRMFWTYWPVILILVGLAKIWDNARAQQNPQEYRHSSIGPVIGIIGFVFLMMVIVGHRGRYRDRNRNDDYSSRMSHRSETIDKKEAKFVTADITMGAGEMTLHGGSPHLLEATFDFRNTSEPQVEYEVENGKGKLTIGQGDTTNFIGRTENTWNLNLSNDIPLDLTMTLGAGQSNLNLRDINLTNLDLTIGAGQANVDLTGDRKKDLTAEINGAVGEADIKLPKNVGVVISATGLLGSIDTHGLRHEDGEYKNDAYGKSPVTIHLTVNGAIGRINLEQEP